MKKIACEILEFVFGVYQFFLITRVVRQHVIFGDQGVRGGQLNSDFQLQRGEGGVQTPPKMHDIINEQLLIHFSSQEQ